MKWCICTGSFRGGKGRYSTSGDNSRKPETVEDCMLLCVQESSCKQILFKHTHKLCYTFEKVVQYENTSDNQGWNTYLYEKL